MITPFIAAVIIGSFWTGVGVTAVANNSDFFDHARQDVVITATTASDHENRCAAHYRSYERASDSFYGYDGQWHVCRL